MRGDRTAKLFPAFDMRAERATRKGRITMKDTNGTGYLPREQWLEIDLFERLSRSAFRSRFHLSAADRAYIEKRGMDTVRSHAYDLVRKRLAPAQIPNDGKQTPMRGAPKGHPVFLAQHATATCCRGCLEKWHGIPAGRELTEAEIDYVVDVIMTWVEREAAAGGRAGAGSR